MEISEYNQTIIDYIKVNGYYVSDPRLAEREPAPTLKIMKFKLQNNNSPYYDLIN